MLLLKLRTRSLVKKCHLEEIIFQRYAEQQQKIFIVEPRDVAKFKQKMLLYDEDDDRDDPEKLSIKSKIYCVLTTITTKIATQRDISGRAVMCWPFTRFHVCKYFPSTRRFAATFIIIISFRSQRVFLTRVWTLSPTNVNGIRLQSN